MRIKTVAGILLLIFGLAFCQKGEDNPGSRGIITGPDLRDCACCGGWYITIDTTDYEFDTLPVNSEIDLGKETFPVYVRLDWQLSERLPCPNKWITITWIKKE
jgi:hypothetical protein